MLFYLKIKYLGIGILLKFYEKYILGNYDYRVIEIQRKANRKC